MTFQIEFPDYPVESLPAIPSHWTDVSWHNDACPCWQVSEKLCVFIDYLDIAQREFFDDNKRFHAFNPDDYDVESLSTDDWQEVLDFADRHA